MKRLVLLLVTLVVAVALAAPASGAINYFRINDLGGGACAPGVCQLVAVHGGVTTIVGIGGVSTFNQHLLVWWFATGTLRWGDQYPFTYNGWITTPTDGVQFSYYARKSCEGGGHYFSAVKYLSNTVDYARRNLGVFQLTPGCV